MQAGLHDPRECHFLACQLVDLRKGENNINLVALEATKTAQKKCSSRTFSCLLSSSPFLALSPRQQRAAQDLAVGQPDVLAAGHGGS